MRETSRRPPPVTCVPEVRPWLSTCLFRENIAPIPPRNFYRGGGEEGIKKCEIWPRSLHLLATEPTSFRKEATYRHQNLVMGETIIALSFPDLMQFGAPCLRSKSWKFASPTPVKKAVEKKSLNH